MNYQVITGGSVAIVAVLLYYEMLFVVFTICAHLAIAALGMYLGLSWALVKGKQHVPTVTPREQQQSHVRLVLQNMMVKCVTFVVLIYF